MVKIQALPFLVALAIVYPIYGFPPHNDQFNETANISWLNNDTLNDTQSKQPSLGTVIINTQVFTIFNYKGSQIYVYSALSNEKDNIFMPQKWIFYFVPIMIPTFMTHSSNSWAFTVGTEIRVNLMISNDEVERLARQAIARKFDASLSQHSNFWDVAPLMIDSLTAYIVRGTGFPIEGVHPYKAVHPNRLVMQFRFPCSSEKLAVDVANHLLADVYQIEIAFSFAGFNQITMNSISITSDQLKSVLSKTISDGGNTNPQYIHRNQGSTFVSKYTINVKKMIYVENPNTNISSLYDGLEDQFISLLQQGMAFSDQLKIEAKVFDQVWSSSDLNPDRITNELSKLFIYSKNETELHNFSDDYFHLNEAYAQSLSASGGGGINILKLGSIGGTGSSSSNSQSSTDTTKQRILSRTEIQNFLHQQAIETEWSGEKFIPKSFYVYKLTDITDRLQVAIIAKQIYAERANGAILRTVSSMDGLEMTWNPNLWPFVGEVKMYSGDESNLPKSWLFCHGQAISRVTYKNLFSVIGQSYGIGDGSTTFNVPDFRARFPLGANPTNNVSVLMSKGGSATQVLSENHLPAHSHSSGTLYVTSGGQHNHAVQDPGHNHGGRTDTQNGGSGGWNLKGNGKGPFDDWAIHSHNIPTGHTGVKLSDSGAHTHTILGSTSSTGSGQAFDIMPPYQKIHYIIFAGYY